MSLLLRLVRNTPGRWGHQDDPQTHESSDMDIVTVKSLQSRHPIYLYQHSLRSTFAEKTGICKKAKQSDLASISRKTANPIWPLSQIGLSRESPFHPNQHSCPLDREVLLSHHLHPQQQPHLG